MQNCCPVLHILFSGRGSQTLLAHGHLNVFGMVHIPMFLENLNRNKWYSNLVLSVFHSLMETR